MLSRFLLQLSRAELDSTAAPVKASQSSSGSQHQFLRSAPRAFAQFSSALSAPCPGFERCWTGWIASVAA